MLTVCFWLHSGSLLVCTGFYFVRLSGAAPHCDVRVSVAMALSSQTTASGSRASIVVHVPVVVECGKPSQTRDQTMSSALAADSQLLGKSLKISLLDLILPIFKSKTVLCTRKPVQAVVPLRCKWALTWHLTESLESWLLWWIRLYSSTSEVFLEIPNSFQWLTC